MAYPACRLKIAAPPLGVGISFHGTAWLDSTTHDADADQTRAPASDDL
jgi:hypothetical protein